MIDVARIWDRQRAARRPVVLIDGSSGAGKTTFARRLVAAAPVPVQLVSLDDVFPGWDGLAAGAAAVVADILRPTAPGYRRWDWAHDRPGEWVALDPALGLVVEGCGALTPASRALATLGVWLDAPPEVRRLRAVARDGADTSAHWGLWAAQEHAHRQADHPEALADLALGTDTGSRPDPPRRTRSGTPPPPPGGPERSRTAPDAR